MISRDYFSTIILRGPNSLTIGQQILERSARFRNKLIIFNFNLSCS